MDNLKTTDGDAKEVTRLLLTVSNFTPYHLLFTPSMGGGGYQHPLFPEATQPQERKYLHSGLGTCLLTYGTRKVRLSLHFYSYSVS